MKKKLLKLVNYTLILFLLALSGCEKDLYENAIKEPAKASGQINYVTIDDVPLIKPNVEKFKKNISSKTAKGKISDLDLDLEHIIQYTESNGFTSYSIPIKIDTLETKDYYFQNLNIITDGKEYGSFVVKYNPDNDLKAFDLSTFTGTTEYFDENLNLKQSVGFVNGIPNESNTVNTNHTSKNETPAPSIEEEDGGGGGGIDADDSGSCPCNSTSLIQQFFEWVGKVLASINISLPEGSGDNKAYVLAVTPPNTGTPTYAGSTVETFSGGGSITFVPNEPQWTYPISSQNLMATRIMQRIEAIDPLVFTWLADINNLEYVKILYFYLYEENSLTTRKFAKDFIDVLKQDTKVDKNAFNFVLNAQVNNKIYNELDADFFLSVDQYMDADIADINTRDPDLIIYFGTHQLLRALRLKALNPQWSYLKCYWEASKVVVHITLDVFGTVPVVGELADISNGVLYLIEGDGVNASLSIASAVPIAGWAAVSTKYAIKFRQASTIATKVKLVWKVTGNVITFGSRSQLRKVLGLVVGDLRQAHHIIPWNKQSKLVIQKASKSQHAFHMNEAINGIPLSTTVHSGSHSHYDDLIQGYLDRIPDNATPDQCYQAVNDIINKVRVAIQNNPGVHINQLNF